MGGTYIRLHARCDCMIQTASMLEDRESGLHVHTLGAWMIV